MDKGMTMSGVFVCLVLVVLGVKAGNENDKMKNLADKFWDWRLENSPEFGSKYGLKEYDQYVSPYTEQSFDELKTEADSFLSQAKNIKISKLNTQNKINVAVLKDLLQNFIEGYEFRKYGAFNAINSLENPVKDWKNVVLNYMTYETEKDYENLLAKYDAIRDQIDARVQLMEAGSGLGPHMESMDGVLEAIEAELVDDPKDSIFYLPFTDMPVTIPEERRRELQQLGEAAVRDKVIPAWSDLLDYVDMIYFNTLRPTIGVGSLPNGEAYYKQCLKWHLSVEMTPQEIHDLGLSEVERIKGEMEKLRDADNFEGTIEDYNQHLREQTANYYQTGEEMLTKYREIMDRAHSKLDSVLKVIPKAPVGVEGNENVKGALGRYMEPSMDGSRGGMFWANTNNLSDKPKFSMTALTLHEAEPGHHTLAAMALEQNIPNFRRIIEYRNYNAVPFNWPFHTAFIEGWALYAESLGEEMGIYDEPNSLFGRYQSEIFRAARLVVDTGIHAFGWSKEQAVDYLESLTSMGRHDIETEVKRYISWPGQACAYKIGELKIKESRKKAEEKMGDQFDLREFHNQVLTLGPAPLPVLQDHINNWIARETGIKNEEPSPVFGPDNGSHSVHGSVSFGLGLLICVILKLLL